MRILLLTDRFAPHLGGTAQLYYQWAKRLSDLNVRVITRKYPGSDGFDRGAEFSVRRLPFINIPKLRMPLLWVFIFLAAVVELCKSRKNVVLHAGQILETGVTAYLLSLIFSIPYVIHVFGEEINHYAKRGFTRKLMGRILKGAASVTSISLYTTSRLKMLDLYHGEVELVRPAVDMQRFAGRGRKETRDALGLGPDDLVLLTVSRLMERKGHDRVLDAIAGIIAVHPNVVYLIAGVGTQENRLRQLVKDLAIESHVRFLGSVFPEALEGIYSAADIFVHPNREVDGDIEGFGMVFLEASACSVPVIGGNSGGAPDAIQDGVSGFLVDPESLPDLTQMLLRLIEDKELRRLAGEAGPAWARQFTWEKAASQIRTMTLQLKRQS